MATSKQNLSDLLRQEAQQDKSETTKAQPVKTKTAIPEKPAAADLSRMTKAQLLEYINSLYEQQPAPTAAADNSAIVSKNQELANQVKALEARIADQEQAIAKAEKTIKSLKTDSAEKTKLEKELGKQQELVAQLHTQIQTLEAQKEAAIVKERTVEGDRALVLAKISSYQVNLQFPSQPQPSISEEDIGWFD